MPRTLRSKSARGALWYAADGRCQLCGGELGAEWQADHTIAWSMNKRTNVNDMWALCGPCNRRKGSMGLRAHQAELVELLQQIEAGREPLPTFIGCHVCCGGGKQALAGICAHYLIEVIKAADRVCWVTPNGTLRAQAMESLLPGSWLANVLGHQLEIYESRNDPNPSKNKSGYAITYHALAADGAGINRREFERHRYLLILDEPHHVVKDGVWDQAVRPLIARAAMTLLMSGTLDRNDRKAVGPFEYRADRTVDTISRSDFRWIHYRQRDALREKAIVPVHFQHFDGKAEWIEDGSKAPVQAETLGNNSRAVFAALNSEYAAGLLESCLTHWAGYRRATDGSKMLVVCAGIKQAKAMLAYCKKRGFRDAEIATSESDDADDAIRRFKGERIKPGEREIDLLITVAMAYEGLDVPAITHLACLTHIRSRPWIQQMIARAWRYCASMPRKVGMVFCPDDVMMRECIRGIEHEQEAAVRIAEAERIENGAGGAPDHGSSNVVITPTYSEVTEQRASELGGESIAASDTMRFLQVAQTAGLPLTPIEVKRIIDANDALKDHEAVGVANGRGDFALTHQERLGKYRSNLDETVREVARRLCRGAPEAVGLKNRDINAEVKKRFGERGAMDMDTVQKAIAWVRWAHGLDTD